MVNNILKRVDHSTYPPFVAFRFEKQDDEFIDFLINRISNYIGKVSWILTGRQRDGLVGVNWIVQPKKVFEVEALANEISISPNKYISLNCPGFGPVAYGDFNDLTDYLECEIDRWESEK